MSVSTWHCDCCGLVIQAGMGVDCPRCGYPINTAKEEAFLRASVRDLQRVAQYGGANMTVAMLMNRYQARLGSLTGRASVVASSVPPQPVQGRPRSGLAESAWSAAPASSQQDLATTARPAMLPTSQASDRQSKVKQPFSMGTFFADQTINIVASLGAFLILIGSLSFITTTANLLLALIVVFIVHLIFGAIGVISYRFASLRIVSVIYTAIFALLVPLVGFSAYRLSAGPAFHVSATLLVALTAAYAAGTYGVLAIYQRFKPFGYLAAAALLVMDLSFAATLHLRDYWWSVALLLLAFPLLIFERQPASSGPGVQMPASSVLREPAQLLMGFCIVCGVLCMLVTALYPFTIYTGMQVESRFSVLAITLLLTLWLVLFIALARRYQHIAIVPYLCTVCLPALLYAFSAPRLAYVLVLTLQAVLAAGLAHLDLQSLHAKESHLVGHLETLALLLVALVPLIAAPNLVPDLLAHAYAPQSSGVLGALLEIAVDTLALLLGCGLTIVIMLRHTGWQKTLSVDQARWCGLLLLSGLITNYVYALLVVDLNITPIWAMLGFFILCSALAVWARRVLSASWAAPLEVLSLFAFVEVLLLGLNVDAEKSIVLLLALAALFYALALYQRRQVVFSLFLLCALLALPHLFNTAPAVLLLLALLLPPVSVGIYRTLQYKRNGASPAATQRQAARYAWAWEWPLLLVGVGYGICLAFHDGMGGTSTLQLSHWLALPSSINVSVTLELALLAVVWYVAALLAQHTSQSIIAIAFALWGVALIPQTMACPLLMGNTTACLQRGQAALYSLAGVALLATVAGVCIDWWWGQKSVVADSARLYERMRWSWPWYVISLGAVVTLLVWNGGSTTLLPAPAQDTLTVLCGLSVAALLVMLARRTPEIVVLVTLLAGRALASAPWPLWQQMLAYSLLCVLLFCSQFIWRLLAPAGKLFSPARLSAVLGLGGQLLVVLFIIASGGLFAQAGLLAHMGAVSLLGLALLTLWWGYLHAAYTLRWTCIYTAGFLCTLALSWELSALGLTQLETLWLAPASYLIVVAPFLARNERLPWHHLGAQLCAIAGTMLLLLPTLWFSFSQNNLQPSLLLAGESLLLLLLGLLTRVRIFVLSSVSFIIITAIHVLFLPSLGMPTFLALSLLGILLLVIATSLVLIRSRLASLWTQWE